MTNKDRQIIGACVDAHIYGRPVSINWQQGYMQIDARERHQYVTTCIIRPTGNGPREVFTATVVASPADLMTTNSDQGKRLSLGRAIYAYLNSGHFDGAWYSKKTAWDIARNIFYRIMAQQIPEEVVDESETCSCLEGRTTLPLSA